MNKIIEIQANYYEDRGHFYWLMSMRNGNSITGMKINGGMLREYNANKYK